MVAYDQQSFAVAHLYDISKQHLRCFYGHYIGEKKYREKGLAKHISCNIYDYVFFTLGLNKICAEIVSSNKKVIEMAKKRGYEQEGYFKQHICKNGQTLDVVRMCLLSEAWQQVRTKVDYQSVTIK